MATKTFGLRLDQDLVRELDAAARAAGCSRNQFVEDALREAVRARLDLRPVLERAFAEADCLVGPELAVLEVRIRACQDRVSLLEAEAVAAERRLQALEDQAATVDPRDVVEHAGRLVEAREAVRMLQDLLAQEREALRALRAERGQILRRRMEAAREAFREPAREWLRDHGDRLARDIAQTLMAWVQGLGLLCALDRPGDRLRAARYFWHGLMAAIRDNVEDEAIRSLFGRALFADWDWPKVADLSLGDFEPALPEACRESDWQQLAERTAIPEASGPQGKMSVRPGSQAEETCGLK